MAVEMTDPTIEILFMTFGCIVSLVVSTLNGC